MPESDLLITPQELRRREPKFGLAFQRKHRVAGDFIPHIRIGNRIFYRLSSIERFLAESETGGGSHDFTRVVEQEAETAQTVNAQIGGGDHAA